MPMGRGGNVCDVCLWFGVHDARGIFRGTSWRNEFVFVCSSSSSPLHWCTHRAHLDCKIEDNGGKSWRNYAMKAYTLHPTPYGLQQHEVKNINFICVSFKAREISCLLPRCFTQFRLLSWRMKLNNLSFTPLMNPLMLCLRQQLCNGHGHEVILDARLQRWRMIYMYLALEIHFDEWRKITFASSIYV